MNALPPRKLTEQVEPLPADLEAQAVRFARALARALAAEHHKALEQAAAEKPPAAGR